MIVVLRTQATTTSARGAADGVGLGLGLLAQAPAPFQPLELLRNNSAVVTGIVGDVYPPFMVLPCTPRRALDAPISRRASIGAGQARTFFSVVVSLARPGIISGVILVFIRRSARS